MSKGTIMDFRDCSLFINGVLIEKDDALIVLASELTLGNALPKIKKLGLSETDLKRLEDLLNAEIFGKGNCLTPDLEEGLFEFNDFDDDDEF